MSTELATLQIFTNCIDETLHPVIVASLGQDINFLTAKLIECLRLKEKIALNVCGDNYLDKMLLSANISEFN
jgi:hypothetical protein